MGFNDVAFIYVKESVHRIIFWYMSKDDAISLRRNSNLIDKKMLYDFFFIFIKKWVRKLIIKETEMWY